MGDLESEFQRQMHSIKQLIVTNMTQMRDEMRQTSNTTVAPSSQEQSAAAISTQTQSQPERRPSNESSNFSMGNRHKKIYPLPPFTGAPEEWQTFYEAFMTTTQEFEYSNLHNIMRMRDALNGRAKDTVESLLASSENVNAIIDILKETFGRPEQLIKSQVEKVRLIPAVADGNLESLVSFANKIANMTTFLKNGQGMHHLSNPMLLSELVCKLPLARQMQWAEKCLLLDAPATIVHFNDWLSTLRRLANMVNDSLPSTSTAAVSTRRTQPPPSTTQHTKRFAGVTVNPKKCLVCNNKCPSLHECKPFLDMSVDERWNKIKTLRLCFSCLKSGHQVRSCHFKNILCGTNGCQKVHHKLLHSVSTTNTNPESDSQPIIQQNIARNCHAQGINTQILFQILPIFIYINGKAHKTYAFIDDGANVSMIDREFADSLGLQGKRESLELQWLNDKRIREESKVVNFSISGTANNAQRFDIKNIYTSKNLSLPTQSCQMSAISNIPANQFLNKLQIENYFDVQPKLILSLSHSYLTVPLETPHMCPNGGPIAMRTRLGWVIYGPVANNSSKITPRVMHARFCNEKVDFMESINNMMKNYFDLETLGVKADVKKVISSADERALSILEKTTVRKGERYESGMLWKDNLPDFPDSFQMALNRLYTVEKKMSRVEEYANEYN